MFKTKFLIILLFAFVISINSILAQIPDEFTNLKLLPKNIEKKQLIDIMKNFSSSLGVRCNYCHAGKEGMEASANDLSTIDFASDAIPAKDITRVMMEMNKSINNDYISKITEKSELSNVKCITCHKGMEKPPRRIQDIIFDEITTNGAEAGFNKYKELREKYYSNFVYNFAFKSISSLSNLLRKSNKNDECLKFLEMFKVYNQDMWRVYFETGKTYHNKEDLITAEKYYDMALELKPGNEDILWYKDKIKAK